MSEEQFGNQTEQQVEQLDNTQVEEQAPDTTQEESNYFEVKYNKEPVKVSYDEAPDYIQKGMNYDKVQGKLSDYETRLNDLASLSGYQSTDELFSAMEQAKQDQERQKYEDAGIDPDTFNSLLENHPDIQYAREMKQKQEAEQKFNDEVSEFFGEFPDVKPDDISPDVWQLKEEKGLSLTDAYLRVNYKNMGQKAEQSAIQKLQTNAQTSPGSLAGGDTNHKTSISGMSNDDFKALQDRVLRGEKVQF